jgi:hypothetical protein
MGGMGVGWENVPQTTWRERGTEELKHAALGPGAFQTRARREKFIKHWTYFCQRKETSWLME